MDRVWVLDADGEEFEVVLPARSDAPDFARRITEVVETIAVAARLSGDEVMKQLLAAPGGPTGLPLSAAMSAKPLGRKAYGSIGHLTSSRLGPADHHVDPGQSDICTVRPVKGKTVWVQAKLDGSCCAVAKVGGEIVPLVRAGYRAESSRFVQHHLFAIWVRANADRFDVLLDEGERVVGEWLALAHSTRYRLDGRSPFVPFDLMVGVHRTVFDVFAGRVCQVGLPVPSTVAGPMLPEVALTTVDHYGADNPEGVVYRVESGGRVDFLAKWVRSDKVDGALLPEVSGVAPVWNWDLSDLPSEMPTAVR